MNPRERMLAVGVLAVVVLAGAVFLFRSFFWLPLEERDASIASLQQELDKKRERINQVLADRPKLERWKQLSLPNDPDHPDLARREYENYLSELFRQSGFAAGSFSITTKQNDSKSSPMITGKGPIYTRLSFTVLAHSNLANLVEMMEHFYRTGLMHQIKNISIQRPLTAAPQQEQSDLDISLTVEALIVSGAENRRHVLPIIDRRLLVIDAVAGLQQMPMGLALVPWTLGPTGPLGPGTLARPPHHYEAIASKNIFFGLPAVAERTEDVDATRFVHLNEITRDEKRVEAFLYDRLTNISTRLRTETGFDSFRVQDEEGETLVRGKVVRIDIDKRDIIFRSEENYYSMHVGQNLEEVLKTPLAPDQVKALGLAAIDKATNGKN